MTDQRSGSPISAEDLAISLAVREDLGREHDSAVVAEFLERVGPAIDARVDATVRAGRERDAPRDTVSSALAFASLGVGIPVTGIALGTTGGGASGLLAMLIGWGGIAAVNLVHSRSRR